jgi:hypothetical protein
LAISAQFKQVIPKAVGLDNTFRLFAGWDHDRIDLCAHGFQTARYWLGMETFNVFVRDNDSSLDLAAFLQELSGKR